MRKISYEFKKDNFLKENDIFEDLSSEEYIERLLEQLEIFKLNLKLAMQEQKYIDRVNQDILKIEKSKDKIIKNGDFNVYLIRDKICFSVYA